MKIDIQATGIELTDPLRLYINEKIGSIEKFLRNFDEDSIHARVEVGRLSRHHRHGNVYHAQVNLHIPGGMLQAKHDDEDVRVAIDKVKQILQREIRKHKATH